MSALTSTTAPGKVFESRAALAEHYKSDWHKYNLKRREAGLPLLREEDFRARWEAALALRREREQREERSGTDHLKNKKKTKGRKIGSRKAATGQKVGDGVVTVSQAAAYDRIKANAAKEESTEQTNEEKFDSQNDVEMEGEQEIEEEPPMIEPRQCLFDKHMSATVELNIERMNRKYGFFLPDQEYLVDTTGLIGYCHEKIKLGHCCLYCQKLFRTWEGCQKHMVSTRHTKLRYERGFDLDEFDPFYDFSEADAEFLAAVPSKKHSKNMEMDYQEVVEGEDDDIDSDEWEDVTDDEDMDEADDHDVTEDDGLYAGYEDEIAKFGFDVTPLGELVFPDGRIVGHRGLSRYYKQRYTHHHEDRTAIVAARRAAGERLYNGRVYSIGNNNSDNNNQETALSLARAGVAPGAAAGRAGKGILVQSSGGGYTALSLYRYKAVVNKARRDEARGQRLENRTKQNINRMDKKANRLMNNVSVAHAKR